MSATAQMYHDVADTAALAVSSGTASTLSPAAAAGSGRSSKAGPGSSDIPGFYAGKTLFITGATGFVGKVIVEKLLRSCRDIKKIYILIRDKRGTCVADRFAVEWCPSPIFDRLREERGPGFDDWLVTKVAPIAGDLMSPGLGLSDSDRQLILDTVNLFISCAATVTFNEPLRTAVNMNVLGPLMLLDLAKAGKHVEQFLHISTAYVGSNKPGESLKETFIPISPDPEATLLFLQEMADEDIVRATRTLIGAYPNTYTFTKALCEQVINIRHGSLPTVIVRPTIIGSALAEPVPGWVDTVSAAGALFLANGLGVFRFGTGKEDVVGDQIPVDLVSNFVITAQAKGPGPDGLVVYHFGSSHRHPNRWGNVLRAVVSYWKHNPALQRIEESDFIFRTPFMYQLQLYSAYVVPTAFFTAFAKILPRYQNTANQLQRLTDQIQSLGSSFSTFMSETWIFLMDNYDAVYEWMSPQDKAEFNIDVQTLDWHVYMETMCYGLQKFVLKEDVGLASDLAHFRPDLLSADHGRSTLEKAICDVQWALNVAVEQKVGIASQTITPTAEVKRAILASESVTAAIAAAAARKRVSVATMEREAVGMLDRISADIRPTVVRLTALFFRNIWRRIYRGLIVDVAGMDAVRDLAQATRIVFVPTHRSYVDFLVLSYVCLACNLPIPHIAAGEDFLHIALVHYILRFCGAFFMRRDLGGDPLYKTIFCEYVRHQVIEGHPVEFFVEGTRSRSGKTLNPKMGLLSVVADTVLNGDVDDVSFVPVSINYEKTLEASLFQSELMGQSKVAESLPGLLRASSILHIDFGRVDIRFGTPISTAAYLGIARNLSSGRLTPPAPALGSEEDPLCGFSVPYASSASRLSQMTGDPQESKAARKTLISCLGYDIARTLNSNLCVMPTALVASIVLTYRGGISMSELADQVEWLRGAVVAAGGATVTGSVAYAVALLGRLVVTKNQTMVEPALEGPEGLRNTLLLAYYRNHILHLFAEEAVVAVVAHRLAGEGTSVKLDELFTEIQFLRRLMKTEIVYTVDLKSRAGFDCVIEGMIKKGFLLAGRTRGIVNIPDSAARYACAPFFFVCSLVWPLIDSYYVAALALFSLFESSARRSPMKMDVLLDRMRWLGEKLIEEDKVLFFECVSAETLKNAIATFIDLGVIVKLKVGRRKDITVVRLSPAYDDEAKLLEFSKRVECDRNRPDASHPFGVHGTMSFDYTTMSRL